jgi:hypothetical protein
MCLAFHVPVFGLAAILMPSAELMQLQFHTVHGITCKLACQSVARATQEQVICCYRWQERDTGYMVHSLHVGSLMRLNHQVNDTIAKEQQQCLLITT